MAKKVFAIRQFFAVRFWVADGKELLCRLLADGKELADGKVADSSSGCMNYIYVLCEVAIVSQLSLSHSCSLHGIV